jgi:DNA-directed RNA polymerase subunit alpha
VSIQKNWQELKKPNKLEVIPSRDPKRVATVVASPLERGFGLTLGNALRRVLLSSLQGAAVTAVQIDGVLHEFSSIAGVREDVTDIILNIKEIALRMQGQGPKRMVVRKQGPGVVTAGDIQTVGDIEILNPELVLCTLDDGAEMRMEFTVDTGKGYVPADRNRPEDAPIGLIPVDSLYSPVRKVSYRVENTREGQDLDLDKLTRWLTLPASCRTSWRSSSTSKSRRRTPRSRPFRSSPSIRRCSRRSTNSSCRCVRPTASRTTTSSTSAI